MDTLRILHLESDPATAARVQQAAGPGAATHWQRVTDRETFIAALAAGDVDAVVVGAAAAGLERREALRLARDHQPQAPVIGIGDSDDPLRWLDLGAHDHLARDQLWRLPVLLGGVRAELQNRRLARLARSRALLVEVVKQLSLARSLDAIVDIVKTGARQLNGADGATFVLRDGDLCHYVAEDAIGPLWAGRRFPLRACISGWAMLEKRAAVVPDIYTDPRIPVDAYRPTFVKSLVMVPIRAEAPIGAIGNYWARPYHASDDEVELIQALADSTSLAFENLELYRDLERRVRDRTVRLQAANEELEAFSYSVSHDLRAPLRALQGYADLLLTQAQPPLQDQARSYAERIRNAARRMHTLIEDLLSLSKVARTELQWRSVPLGRIADDILASLQHTSPPREGLRVDIDTSLRAEGDPGLLRIALENLLSNAWKFTGRTPAAHIEFFAEADAGDGCVYVVRDNGAGFDMTHAGELFQAFHRLHTEAEFPGTGVGLTIVQRIVHKHGGRIWVDAAPGRGACFRFTLPPPP
ncbi:hypothetical protein EV699_12519 [Plasticicumulans lactativorans]|uniref:histidine kinase n=1 Tax=Plasticicumulans lactativorans TaxID=1133106 RepID=A0A4R2KXA7_9GAMM|nr:ATP-binding protein [Plasticicumulans lactativorans]TCO77517.1 hypothetical protein EV699_12519 [Plasticicumulans lactativorans]